LREFEEVEIPRQSCRGDCKEKISLDFFSEFCPKIRPLFTNPRIIQRTQELFSLENSKKIFSGSVQDIPQADRRQHIAAGLAPGSLYRKRHYMQLGRKETNKKELARTGGRLDIPAG
jgi:hypothetical protein